MISQSSGVHPSASNCSTTDSSHCLWLTHIHSLTSTMSMASHLLYLMKGTLMNSYIICFTACRLRRSVPSKKALQQVQGSIVPWFYGTHQVSYMLQHCRLIYISLNPSSYCLMGRYCMVSWWSTSMDKPWTMRCFDNSVPPGKLNW